MSQNDHQNGMHSIPWEQLFQVARDKSFNAYCPFSRFPVGASLLADGGHIFGGCNVENASYGLTICAERNVVFQAVANGARKITAVAIYTPTYEVAAPCGACRQVLAQFGIDATVRSFCDSGEYSEWQVTHLLPEAFNFISTSSKMGRKLTRFEQRRRLCIDIDNVLTRTDAVLRLAIKDATHGDVDLKYEDIREFDYRLCSDAKGRTISSDVWEFVHTTLFAMPLYQDQIKPLEDSVESIRFLATDFEIHFATARPPALRQWTLAWLDKHSLGDFDVHFLRQGEKHSALGEFYATVEDNLDQSNSFADAGIPMNFLIAHPWNSRAILRPNLQRVMNWYDIVDALMR